MQGNYKTLLLFLSILGLLPHCGKKAYLKRLPKINPATSFIETKDDLTLGVHAYTVKECKSYFDKNLIAQGYCPIHLSINNRTPDTYVLRPSYITLSMASPQKIAQLLHYNTSLIVTSTCCPALLFFWPAIPLVIVPAGLEMRRYNKKIDQRIDRTAIDVEDTVEIPPYSKVDKLIFVHSTDYQPQFEIMLYNNTKRSLVTFNVRL